MEIHVYDRNLRRLGHIENHTSLQWHRKYYECGTFELHCPVTAENLRLLKPGNVIAKGDNKLEAAVIRGDQTEEESTLVNEITRNGKFLPVYLGDRLTGPLFNYSGTVEDAMRFMLGRMAAVPLLQIAEGTGDKTKIQFQATYKNVLEYLTKLARYAEIGFRVVPDFKKKTMTFETYKGIDRTQAQGKNPRVIFSESYDNLNQAKHNYSDESMKTKVIVGGAGEGLNRVYVTVGGGSGFDLREVFLDAKDSLRIYELSKGEGKEKLHVAELTGPLPAVLGAHLGLDRVTMIRCGGRDRIASEREQWNDGSNTLCIAPGKVIVYDRNYITNSILERNGIEVLEMPSAELSRGRGGPRCMSMPLIREEL